jgi:hypothetical protein
MDLKKIESLVKTTSVEIEDNAFSEEEFLIFMANMLISYGKAGLALHKKFQDIDTLNANAVELMLNQNPNDVHLSSILQGHVLILWSQNLEKGNEF